MCCPNQSKSDETVVDNTLSRGIPGNYWLVVWSVHQNETMLKMFAIQLAMQLTNVKISAAGVAKSTKQQCGTQKIRKVESALFKSYNSPIYIIWCITIDRIKFEDVVCGTQDGNIECGNRNINVIIRSKRTKTICF